MTFYERLKELRISRNLSQAEFAKQLGISASSISMYECGQREPSFEIEERIADFFNVDLDYLRGGSDTTSKIISGDGHLLLHIFNELDEVSQKMLLSYARGMLDLKIERERSESK